MRQWQGWQGNHVTRVAMPVRALLHRFGYVLLLATAFTLMALSKADLVAVERVRAALSDVMAPMLDALSQPMESVREVVTGIDALFTLHQDNQALRENVENLRRWEILARQLQQENEALRSLLHYKDDVGSAFVSARVIADSGSAFVRTVLLNAGASDGITRDQAVITGSGLVGRIVETGHRAARVLLLTDLNSRIPVVLERSRHRAILGGDNSETAFLDLVPENAVVSPGDRIVTSGHGGLFPPGLPIGVVASVSEGDIRVTPFADFSRLEYVRVVDWAPPVLTPLPIPDHPPAQVEPALAAPLAAAEDPAAGEGGPSGLR